MSDAAIELSINERVNSQLYSDVISSYVDINSVTAQRNIVPGSYKETVVQCTDQTLSTLNSAGGQTLFTRFKLTPQVRNATLAQLARIYFQYTIEANSLGILVKKFTNNTTQEAPELDKGDNLKNSAIPYHLQFKLSYDDGFSISSMVQLCLTADAKVSTENFNYQQTLLTLNSIPDFVTENSNSESTLKALVENPGFRGVGSGLIDIDLTHADATDCFVHTINTDIGIEGCIDLDRGNPLFHNFPIITRNMSELYLRLYMENFLRELKVVYLNKKRIPLKGTISNLTIPTGTDVSLTTNNASPGVLITTAAATNTFTTSADITAAAASGDITGTDAEEYLPYQRLPADKADFVYLGADMYKVKLVNLKQNPITPGTQATCTFAQTNPIYTLNNIHWERFEMYKTEFDVEEYEDIKASQAKAGTYKFPVHIFRSKNFDQTNSASSSSNALQTTLNAPNIDRIFITQPWSRDYYTFLPTVSCTDINPQLHNNPILPRTEDNLNATTIERIGSVFVDTDKYSIPTDLYNSLNVPTVGKQLWTKAEGVYGGEGAYEKIQRGINVQHEKILLPNKFAYAIELNEGGCFRRGFNSVIDGNYSPTVPVNLQQSTASSKNIYLSATYNASSNSDILNKNSIFNASVSYGDIRDSGAVASIHCLCDYIFWMSFDQFGMMTDFGVSEYNDRQ